MHITIVGSELQKYLQLFIDDARADRFDELNFKIQRSRFGAINGKLTTIQFDNLDVNCARSVAKILIVVRSLLELIEHTVGVAIDARNAFLQTLIDIEKLTSKEMRVVIDAYREITGIDPIEAELISLPN
ncbi:hypothetical protein ACZ75_06620 [Massilia sp. NR 4-1]|nr:hypothetical protein ACZ75_06620 [Massilia sp. NR 4-1]